MRSSTTTKVEERDKETSDSGQEVRQKDSPLRNQKSVHPTGTSPLGKKSGPLCFSKIVHNTRIATTGFLRSASFMMTLQISYTLSFRPLRQNMTGF